MLPIHTGSREGLWWMSRGLRIVLFLDKTPCSTVNESQNFGDACRLPFQSIRLVICFKDTGYRKGRTFIRWQWGKQLPQTIFKASHSLRRWCSRRCENQNSHVVYSSEISPTRCNNCVFYSPQWLYSTCFGWQSHPSSGVHMLYTTTGKPAHLGCKFF